MRAPPRPRTDRETGLLWRWAAAGFSQRQIARMLGRHPQTVVQWCAQLGVKTHGKAGVPPGNRNGEDTRFGAPRCRAPLHRGHIRCKFCSWRGRETAYYAHWRENHRTRAGVG